MDLLTEEGVAPALTAGDRDGVIDELLDLLITSDQLPAELRAAARQAVMTRESTQTTGLGSGVAVPHGITAGLDDVVCALGIHEGGIDFNAVDSQPVQLVILLLVPPNRFQTHIRTLAGIARVLNDPALRRKLVAAETAADLIQILEEREGATV